MKSTRCIKWTALLLAVILGLSMCMTSALANDNDFGVGTVFYTAPLESFVDSDEIEFWDTEENKKVDDLSKADPNHTLTLNLVIKEPEDADKTTKKLPTNTDETVMTYNLENMTADGGENDDVSWTYEPGLLVFEWKNGYKSSFSASVTIHPSYPAENEDLSGEYALKLTKNFIVTDETFSKEGRDRVRALGVKKVGDKWSHESFVTPTWTLTRVTGDWYTISRNGRYMKFIPTTGDFGSLILTGKDEADLIKVVKAKTSGYYALQAHGLELNNPKHDPAQQGFASYKSGNPASAGDNNQFCLIPLSDFVTEATADISGNWVILNPDNSHKMVLENGNSKSGKIDAGAYETQNNEYVLANDAIVWKFENVTRDWYYVSNSGKYLSISKNGVNLVNDPQPVRVQSNDGYTTVVISGEESNEYYALASKSGSYADGFGSVKYNISDTTKMKLVAKSQLANEKSDTYLVFDINGGNVYLAPNIDSAEAGQTVTLPGYSGKKNNTSFIGWATIPDIYTKPEGSNNTYTEVYLPGTAYTVPSEMTTLYAVYNERGTNATFGFRLDRTIPDEPGDYEVKNYGGHIDVKNTVILGKWVVDIDATKEIEGNHIKNDVTANLKVLPTDAEIKAHMPEYDPETMYIHWYVLKYAGKWKIDGVLCNRVGKTITYATNVAGNLKETISKMPLGGQVGAETPEFQISVDDNGNAVDPVREGYDFLGWNTKADGSGDAYKSGDTISAESNITLYAQWQGRLKVSLTSNVDGQTEVFAGTEIVLTAHPDGTTYEGKCEYIWEYEDPANGIERTVIEGEHGQEYRFRINEENAKYRYYVILAPEGWTRTTDK